jgi:hypothetical protein
MICPVSVQEARPASQQQKPKIGWWSRLSPWWWGLMMLLALTLCLAILVPRTAPTTSPVRPNPSASASPASVRPPGAVYPQAMTAGRGFADANLSGARLAQLDLRGKDFRDADAAGAVFVGSLLNGANFTHANLRGTDLRDACLRGVVFTAAELSGADFTGADVTGATVTPAAISAAIGWESRAKPGVCSRN